VHLRTGRHQNSRSANYGEFPGHKPPIKLNPED
jgi:hypothetical protein